VQEIKRQCFVLITIKHVEIAVLEKPPRFK
jgi:hypothetical protein